MVKFIKEDKKYKNNIGEDSELKRTDSSRVIPPCLISEKKPLEMTRR